MFFTLFATAMPMAVVSLSAPSNYIPFPHSRMALPLRANRGIAWTNVHGNYESIRRSRLGKNGRYISTNKSMLNMSIDNSPKMGESAQNISDIAQPLPYFLVPKPELAAIDDKSLNEHANSHSASTIALTSLPTEQNSEGASIVYTEEERAYLFVEEEVSLDDVYEKAISRTLLWVAAASLFGVALANFVSVKTAEEFFAGYIVEQSLSVDNLFVFLLLFDYFKVPTSYQDRVLGWGIAGAIVMRGVMIGLGAAALQEFHSILLLFASFLVYSGAATLWEFMDGSSEEEEDADVSDDVVVKFSKQLFDSVDYFDGDRFFTLVEGVKKATPLLLCMVAVEISDVVFAVDSVPAVFGVTENPLIVFSSNMFAIMGLRSLYTVLSKAAADLEYLEPAVALVLGFIGTKMIAEYFGVIIPVALSLVVVSSLLGSGVALSLWSKRRKSNTTSEISAMLRTKETSNGPKDQR